MVSCWLLVTQWLVVFNGIAIDKYNQHLPDGMRI